MAPQQRQKSQSIPLIPVSRLDEWAQPVFEGVSFFNRLQSWVFEIAYNSDNNMLVCAPTGFETSRMFHRCWKDKRCAACDRA